MGLNRSIVMGRVSRAPELRQTPNGVSTVTFDLAVERVFKDKATGEKQVDWITCVAWRNTAEFFARYFDKGRMAVVEGRLQIRNWEDNNGNKRRTAEIVAENIYFGDSRPGGESGGQAAYQSSARPDVSAEEYHQEEYQEILEDDSELPF